METALLIFVVVVAVGMHENTTANESAGESTLLVTVRVLARMHILGSRESHTTDGSR